MSDPIIKVNNLSKRYRIGAKEQGYKTFREAIMDGIAAPVRNLAKLRRLTKFKDGQWQNDEEDVIWALKGVSLEVNEGEVLGIIGRNGAGKSTLLKVLSRITEPTTGSIEIHGRVSSLLEVGTGFHPELTGRENIFLNGAILGMRKREIEGKFDEIVSFAEIEKFIDTPLKRYSSGMYVRLAFAVAAHLEPEILLVDEVLAVGDVGFQKKCLGKMKDVTTGGRTVLFVSHNMGTISSLCERAVLLAEGHIDFMGPTREVVSKYLANFSADAGLQREWSFKEAPGGENLKIRRVAITDHQGIGKLYFSTTEPIFVTIEYWILRDGVPMNVYFWLFDENGNAICVVGNYNETKTRPIKKSGLYRSRSTIPGNLLNSGKHTITVDMVRNLMDMEVSVPHCVAFETVDDQRIHSGYSKWGGVIKPEFQWQSKRLGNVEKMGVHDS